MGRRTSDNPRIPRSLTLTADEYQRCHDAAKLAGMTFSCWAATVLDARAKVILSTSQEVDVVDAKLSNRPHELPTSIADAFNRLREASDNLRIVVETYNNQLSNTYRKTQFFNKLALESSQKSSDVVKVHKDNTGLKHRSGAASGYPTHGNPTVEPASHRNSTSIAHNITSLPSGGSVEGSVGGSKIGSGSVPASGSVGGSAGGSNGHLYPQEAGGMLGALAGPLTTPTEEILARLLSAPAVGDDVDDE